MTNMVSADQSTNAGYLLYLSRQHVEVVCQSIDPVAAISAALALHAQGQTVLPDEAYLGWTNRAGEASRSLNMPSFLGGQLNAVGTKIINANPANPKRNIPRADGVTLLFDADSARILCVMEGAYISALRTACVSAIAMDHLKPPAIECLAIIGSGVLAAAHINLLLKRFPELHQVRLFDLDPQRAQALQTQLAPLAESLNVTFTLAHSAEEAIRPAQVIVPVTTTTTCYIPYEWLQPGAMIVNISLDDVCPEVVLKADKLVVDDWHLVKTDDRRLLGRMNRQGLIDFATDEAAMGAATTVQRWVDAELGEIIIGKKPGRARESDIILVNPFGLSIEDIALAHLVYEEARKRELGIFLER